MTYKFSRMRRIFFPLAIVLMVVTGCYKRISPDGGGDEEEATVHLNLSLLYPTDWAAYKEVSYDTKADENVKRLVRLYPFEEGAYATTPAYEFTQADGFKNGIVYGLDVKPAKYRIAVWTAAEGWYKTEDFAEVALSGVTYRANSEERDAFFGLKELDLSGGKTVSGVVVITMERPHARYEFIATDKEAFAAYLAKEKSKTEVDFSAFHVRYSYPQFMPSAFSVFSRKPVDSATGVEFDARMSLLEDGTVSLGFDYVLVGDEASSIVVTLSFYDDEGEFVSSLSDIEVPLKRGKVTTVKGKLLTSGISNGITIDPGFEGEFIINI